MQNDDHYIFQQLEYQLETGHMSQVHRQRKLMMRAELIMTRRQDNFSMWKKSLQLLPVSQTCGVLLFQHWQR